MLTTVANVSIVCRLSGRQHYGSKFLRLGPNATSLSVCSGFNSVPAPPRVATDRGCLRSCYNYGLNLAEQMFSFIRTSQTCNVQWNIVKWNELAVPHAIVNYLKAIHRSSSKVLCVPCLGYTPIIAYSKAQTAVHLFLTVRKSSTPITYSLFDKMQRFCSFASDQSI